MAKLKLNLKDVKTTMEPIPAGPYPVEVVDADIRMGKDSGLPYLWMHLKIPDEVEEYGKRRLFFQGGLDQDNDVALGITMGNLEALYLRELTGEEFKDWELDTDDLIGLEAIAIVKIGEDLEGNPRNEVGKLKPLEGEDAEVAKTKMEEADEAAW